MKYAFFIFKMSASWILRAYFDQDYEAVIGATCADLLIRRKARCAILYAIKYKLFDKLDALFKSCERLNVNLFVLIGQTIKQLPLEHYDDKCFNLLIREPSFNYVANQHKLNWIYCAVVLCCTDAINVMISISETLIRKHTIRDIIRNIIASYCIEDYFTKKQLFDIVISNKRTEIYYNAMWDTREHEELFLKIYRACGLGVRDLFYSNARNMIYLNRHEHYFTILCSAARFTVVLPSEIWYCIFEYEPTWFDKAIHAQ